MPSSDAVPNVLADPREWVARHGDYLFRFALAKVRQHDAAEELVQETLLAAWRGREKFNGQASERTWMTAILKRKIFDWFANRARSTPMNDLDGVEFDSFTGTGKWKKNPTEWGHDPGDSLQKEEFWAALQACVQKLPRRLHDVFLLRYLQEIGAEEVCQEMNITPSNLWVMLHRARLQLSECLTRNWFADCPREEAKSC